MIKDFDPNPYNIFEIRRAKFPPDHFEYANLPMYYNLADALQKWIENNLKGRYYLGKQLSLDDSNKIEYKIKVGFENEKEMSYFMLACPHLKYN